MQKAKLGTHHWILIKGQMFRVVSMLPIKTFLLIGYDSSCFQILPKQRSPLGLIFYYKAKNHLVMQLEGSLPCTQQPANRLYPEPDNLPHTLHPICPGSILVHFPYFEETERGL
jgi:hypothetical protein